ncbi:60S ribosomal protein L4 [Perkinsus olseni]|uniref:60S ribosomal protein L4 n=2 Tax=Perkinsus olseni TaxID=32597 RepID=A0A7J6M4L7_PEROL|nr:60S ribosomal protein L4 [Perkinsus olseni]KAF4672265.1 60S ribosomal protein L4 [Perkinsus olseni]
MSTARPVVSVYDLSGSSSSTTCAPTVFQAPLRPDLVRSVHSAMAKNKRQARGVKFEAGYETAAASWGTGRAVSRIPRVPGGGTHRSGQGAFGNMCRGGGMFAPLKTWRRWHRKSNLTEKRHAMASAIAASALPPLVMARGHRIGEVPELPLVLSQGVESVQKTKEAIAVLEALGAGADLQKVKDSKKIRAGAGKMRNRRYVMRRGPLVVYSEDDGLTKAFRNIPGIELCQVDRLNLLQVAPGGTFGRFIIWTQPAFDHLQQLFGSYRSGAALKSGYRLPRPLMTNADVAKIINSEEVQAVCRPALAPARRVGQKKNALKNRQMMAKLNPGALHRAKLRAQAQQEGTQAHAQKVAAIRARAEQAKKSSKIGKTFYEELTAAYQPSVESESEDEE